MLPFTKATASLNEGSLYVYYESTLQPTIVEGEYIPKPLWGARIVAHDTKIYMFGGQREESDYGNFDCFTFVRKELFDGMFLQGSWNIVEVKNAQDAPTPRRDHAMVIYEDIIYMFGGYNHGLIEQDKKYIPF